MIEWFGLGLGIGVLTFLVTIAGLLYSIINNSGNTIKSIIERLSKNETKIEAINKSLDEHKKETLVRFDKIDKSLGEIFKDIDFNKGLHTGLMNKHSPLQIGDVGKKIAEEIKADEIVDRLYKSYYKELLESRQEYFEREGNEYGPLKVQEECFSFAPQILGHNVFNPELNNKMGIDRTKTPGNFGKSVLELGGAIEGHSDKECVTREELSKIKKVAYENGFTDVLDLAPIFGLLLRDMFLKDVKFKQSP